jgi:hypothetical protein
VEDGDSRMTSRDRVIDDPRKHAMIQENRRRCRTGAEDDVDSSGGSFLEASGDADFSDREDISFDDPKLSTSRPVNEKMLSDECRRRLTCAFADGTDASAFLCISTRVDSTLTGLPRKDISRTDVPCSHSMKLGSSMSSPHILSASGMDETRDRAMRSDVGVRGEGWSF